MKFLIEFLWKGMRVATMSLVASILLAWLLIGQSDATEFLRATPGSWIYGPTPVWTPGSTISANAKFFPLSQPMSTVLLQKARFSWQMINDSGECEMRPAVRFSDNGSSWGTPKEVDGGLSWATDETPKFQSAYIDLLSLAGTPAGSWIQFGVQTLNRSGSSTSLCNAILRVEPLN